VPTPFFRSLHQRLERSRSWRRHLTGADWPTGRGVPAGPCGLARPRLMGQRRASLHSADVSAGRPRKCLGRRLCHLELQRPTTGVSNPRRSVPNTICRATGCCRRSLRVQLPALSSRSMTAAGGRAKGQAVFCSHCGFGLLWRRERPPESSRAFCGRTRFRHIPSEDGLSDVDRFDWNAS
jgi:hypothetical protein